jgi:hypothetical protein
MIDTNFIAAFANNPLTLTILVVAAIVIIFIWKVSPFFKDLLEHIELGNTNTQVNMQAITTKVDTLITSDAAQAESIRCNTLDILRITVYNSGIAIEDRLVAAKRYFMQGGNGKVASYIKQLIADHAHEWKVVLAMVSEQERAKLEKIIKDTV